MSRSIDASVESYVAFSVELGSRYLGYGGPTSRLEERLSRMGESCGINTEVFALPTGIVVSAISDSHPRPITQIIRIKTSSINLSRVIWLEKLMHYVHSKKMTWDEARLKLDDEYTFHLNPAVIYVASFVAGAIVSYSQFGLLQPSFFSGVLTLLVFFMVGPLARKWSITEIFSDFIGSFSSIFMSFIIANFLNVPHESIAFGTLVFLVPGLTLTNAISELAEHNFVSGTAKLMKGILVLLSIGTAYILVQNIMSGVINSSEMTVVANSVNVPYAIRLLGNLAVITAFSLIFKIPVRMILFALIVGTIGWNIFQLFGKTEFHVVQIFLPAVSVGFLSLLFGRLFKVPSQVFSVPGIFSLVPGLLALSSFEIFLSGDLARLPEICFQVALVCSSITFGLFTAKVPFLFLKNFDLD